jgi:hypothetical protein
MGDYNRLPPMGVGQLALNREHLSCIASEVEVNESSEAPSGFGPVTQFGGFIQPTQPTFGQSRPQYAQNNRRSHANISLSQSLKLK